MNDGVIDTRSMEHLRFNAAVDAVFAPSESDDGIVHFVRTDDFDSLDPGNTYYAYTWNFLRLIGRTLVTFATEPGKAGQQLVPDLAEALGESSDDGHIWTYRLRAGLRYEDGTPITSADIGYAVLRSNFGTDVLGNGPTYLRQYLGSDHPGPYRDPGATLPPGVSTPDDRTIIFTLAKPFLKFNMLATMPSTTPVPRHCDTGAEYTMHPVSSGPYKVQSYVRGRELVLSKNPYWSEAVDPVRRRRAEQIRVSLGVEPHEVDDMLLAGEAHVDLAGFGVQPAAQEKILANLDLRRRADNPLTGFTWIYCMSSKVAPMDNVHCRRAVQYATDKVAMQAAYGGPVGGDIATTIMPPTLDGHEDFDRYPLKADGGINIVAAKAELALAGRPDGFITKIAARVDRLKEYRAAQALSAGLARVGIQTEVAPFQSGEYFEKRGGCPQFLHDNGIGIIMFGWGADFPDGFGFLQQIVDGRAIKTHGNQNMGELDDPQVNDLLDQGACMADAQARAAIWARIDRLVMEHAVIVPYLYPRSLLFRGAGLSNVYVTGAYGMYDYVALGADT